MNQKLIILLILVGCILAITGCTEEASSSDKGSTDERITEEDEKAIAEANKEFEAKQAEEERKAAEKREAEEAERIAEEEAEAAAKRELAMKFDGSGDEATEFFEATSGFVFFEANHKGSSNFTVYLVDENGNEIDLLFNGIGNYKARTYTYLDSPGKFLLKVGGDGAWKINGTQIIPKDVKKAPATLEGSGDDYAIVDFESGLHRFEAEHKGESNFVVRINEDFLLFNGIGNYTGSTAESINDTGLYPIKIEGDGDWSITIE